MPTEIRRLSFSKAEVAQALIAFNKQMRTKILAEGYLSSLVLHGGPGLSIEISVETSEGSRQNVSIDSSIIGAAMIWYCLDIGVPLPVKADKHLDVVDNKLVLDIQLPPHIPPTPTADGKSQAS
jgi:hypothetical protein